MTRAAAWLFAFGFVASWSNGDPARSGRESRSMWHVEAWSIESDETGEVYEQVLARDLPSEEEALRWCWECMDEGFQTRCKKVG